MTLKATLIMLQEEMDELQSSDMSILFEMVEIPDELKMRLATFRDDIRVTQPINTDSQAMTDEEIVEQSVEVVAEDFTNRKEIMIGFYAETSKVGIHFVVPSVAPSTTHTFEKTLGTKAQVQADTQGNDTQHME